MSNNRRTVIPLNLRPRAIRHEPTPEQVQVERHRQKRLCLEALLHAYYKPRKPQTEEVYGGRMNKPIDFSDSSIGCELQPDFVNWMQNHRLTDHEEARHLWLIERALEKLYESHEFWHLVITTHSRTGEALGLIADRFGKGEKLVTEAYNDGIDRLMELLNSDLR